MEPIKDYEVYDSRMKKALIDKAFFLDMVDAEVFVDYGCADASLFGLMSDIFPEYTYIGYDFDEKMIQKAYETMYHRSRATIEDLDYFFHYKWDNIVKKIKEKTKTGKKSCLILSSVIHEVYNYLNEDQIKEFWDRVVNSGLFDYVVIRDMTRSWFSLENFIPEESDIDSNSTMVEHVRETCRENSSLNSRLFDFEMKYGSIDKLRNLAHFFLKYRYEENWDHELNENYFATSIFDIVQHFDRDMWDNEYANNFIPPFIKKQILKDFGFTFDKPTHVKLVFSRRELMR